MNKKSVLITGALGGIGKALCEEFTNVGYFVIGTDIISGNCQCDHFIQLDIEEFLSTNLIHSSKLNSLINLIPFDGLDVLVNNAAVQILGGTDEISLEDWQKTLNINLLSPFFTTKHLLNFLEKKQGSVINIGSVHANLTKPGFVCYATSKSALIGLTNSMAVDLGPRLRINAINPAATATQMLLDGFKDKDDKYKELASNHPLKRIAEPCEIAKAALFLASDDASFITGSCIDIHGGIGRRLHDPL